MMDTLALTNIYLAVITTFTVAGFILFAILFIYKKKHLLVIEKHLYAIHRLLTERKWSEADFAEVTLEAFRKEISDLAKIHASDQSLLAWLKEIKANGGRIDLEKIAKEVLDQVRALELKRAEEAVVLAESSLRNLRAEITEKSKKIGRNPSLDAPKKELRDLKKQLEEYEIPYRDEAAARFYHTVSLYQKKEEEEIPPYLEGVEYARERSQDDPCAGREAIDCVREAAENELKKAAPAREIVGYRDLVLDEVGVKQIPIYADELKNNGGVK